MAELTIERVLDADLETVFAFISQPQHLLKWWGPEGITLPDYSLDFTTTGPWHSVMKRSDGGSVKVSGQVTHVNAPRSLGFTWAWHNEDRDRGPDSHVTLSLQDAGDGKTAFRLYHTELADDASAAAHTDGWTSSLRKLERLAA